MENKVKQGVENEEMLFAEEVVETENITLVNTVRTDIVAITDSSPVRASSFATEDEVATSTTLIIDDVSMNRTINMMMLETADTTEATPVLLENPDATAVLSNRDASSESPLPPTDEAMQVAAWLAYQKFDQSAIEEFREHNDGRNPSSTPT